MANLISLSITFKTHDDGKDDDTGLHIFVKNRANDSSTPEAQSDYISNRLAYDWHDARPMVDSPFLGFKENALAGTGFDSGSSHTVDIPLRRAPIPVAEVLLPVVNIHILPGGGGKWSFSYEVTFGFDSGLPPYTYSSDQNGVTGITLNQNNWNYSGICSENPHITVPGASKPQTEAVLKKVIVVFNTLDQDDNKKDSSTQLNVHIVNRLSATSSQDIAVGTDLLKGQEFPASGDRPSDAVIEFSNASGLPLAANNIMLRDIVLPLVDINIGPTGSNTWIFDYKVCFYFSDGRVYSSVNRGVILDEKNHKHTGVYQGNSFPEEQAVIQPDLRGPAVDHTGANAKPIPLSFLNAKLQEFVTNRQGTGSQYPPIKKLRLHNAGAYGGAEPSSYYDLQSLVANPPSPGTLSPPGFTEGFEWVSGPSDLGQITGTLADMYFNNVNSQSITASIDGTQATPLTVEVVFVPGAQETIGWGHDSVAGMDFSHFWIKFAFTLWDSANKTIDLMSWVPAVQAADDQGQSDLCGKYIDVSVDAGTAAFGGSFQKTMRGRIFDMLTKPRSIVEADPRNLVQTTLRDQVNTAVSSWLLGGLLEGPGGLAAGQNGCHITNIELQGDNLMVSYTGPSKTFAAAPVNWPPVNFVPGTLANIDHIVVVTMENRSFDQMLGYLSLPPDKGGMGRNEVDGLKGGEINFYTDNTGRKVSCPSYRFPAQDTIISPDPSHDHEPVFRAINGGKMDGFAQAYFDEHGPSVAHRIMGYHTADNVPTYDALARDFGICHRWFAPHPGPTFCNRFYELTGRLNIDPYGFWEFNNSSTLRPLFTKTIFDHLKDHGVTWRYFEHGYCFLRFFEGHTFDTQNISSFDDPATGFVALARSGNLPSVSFIDPHFIELPPGGNCDGPPSDIKEGQKFVQSVVEAVVTSPQWSKTLLIVTYDEHGGFYDHVPPPAAVPNSPESLATYGVRVPAFIISPWVKGGTVFGHDGIRVRPGRGILTNLGGAAPQASSAPSGAEREVAHGGIQLATGAPGGASTSAPAPIETNLLTDLHFDHTSILKTIARRFMSDNPPYMTPRYAAANDLSAVIGSEARSNQFLPFIPYNLVYGLSQKRLDVQNNALTPGTILWQWDPNSTDAQVFSFEDAGGGYFYIRTHSGSLYVTADAALNIKQDIKYPTTGGSAAQNPDGQKWKFTSSGIVVMQRNNFTISNAAFPGKVLLPSGNSRNSGVPVVLGDPIRAVSVEQTPNPWQITSPLLPTGLVFHQ